MSRWNQRTQPDDEAGFSGVARLARSGDPLAGIREGDIAVIDVPDLGRALAQELVERKVRAVLNAAESSTGDFPTLGPQVLADAGVTLIDQIGEGLASRIRSGDRLRVEGGRIFKDGVLVGQGVAQDASSVSTTLSSAEQGLATQLESLTVNAADHLRRERALLLEGARVPRLDPRLRKRPVVVVSKTHDWRTDLTGLRRWIKDHDPVLIGAGAGADALLDAKLRPDVIVGSAEELSDRALRSGAHVVVAARSGRNDNKGRFDKAGVEAQMFVAGGEPEDLAILLADSNDAPVIVQVGAAPDLRRFLARGAGEVASTFVTRLRAGRRLVDASAVSWMTSRGMPLWPVLLLLLAGVAAVAAAVGVTPVGQDWYAQLGDQVGDLRTQIEGLFS